MCARSANLQTRRYRSCRSRRWSHSRHGPLSSINDPATELDWTVVVSTRTVERVMMLSAMIVEPAAGPPTTEPVVMLKATGQSVIFIR